MAKTHLEIERRWLLSGLPGPEILEAPSTRFLHYLTLYLCHGDPELRLRQIIELGVGTSYGMAVKEGEEGEERGETLIQPINGARLFQNNIDKNLPFVEKYRYKVKLSISAGVQMAGEPMWQLTWELDEFLGNLKGLFMAEIELPKKSFAVKIPFWLAPLIIKEVTDDRRYYNKNLAVHGMPDPK